MPTGNAQTATARLGSAFGGFIAVPTLLLLATAAVYAIGDAVIAEAPPPKSPGFADGVLASRAVIAAIRIAIIAAAGYIVMSVVALAARRQWLTRVGPVEVSARVSDLEAENALLRDMLESAEARVEDLDEQLEGAESELDTTLDRIGQAWERK